MQQQTFYLSLALATLLIYSCKKDTDTQPVPVTPTFSNYAQLKPGNYWIYQQFTVDTNNNATPTNTFDSCYVDKDTIINKKKYWKLVQPDPFNPGDYMALFHRDSLHYLVNEKGTILFSSEDFSGILESSYITAGLSDTVCKFTRQMTDINLNITTPAGTFKTLNAKETFAFYPNFSAGGAQRSKQMRYAKNIGIVTETLPFQIIDPNYVERRLVRYSVK